MDILNYDAEKTKNEEMIERVIREHLKIEDPEAQKNIKKLLIFQILN